MPTGANLSLVIGKYFATPCNISSPSAHLLVMTGKECFDE